MVEVFVQQSAQIQVKVWEGTWLHFYCLLAGTFFGFSRNLLHLIYIRRLLRIHVSQKIRLLFLTKFCHNATLARTTITAKSTLRARHPIFWPSTGLPTKQPHISRWL